MTEQSASQSAFNPFNVSFAHPAFAAFGPSLETFRKAAEANVARMQSMYDELGRAEGRGAEQARVAIDESARLMRESIGYAVQLSAEWRRLSIEAAQKATALFAVPAAR